MRRTSGGGQRGVGDKGCGGLRAWVLGRIVNLVERAGGAASGWEVRGTYRSEASSGRRRVCGVASARAAIKTQVRQVPCTGARVHAARRGRAAGAGRGRD